MTSNEKFRRNLSRIMKKKKLTQRDVERLGNGIVSQAALSFFLSGKNDATLDLVDKLAKILRCKSKDLIN